MKTAAIGVRTHSGWGVLVAVSRSAGGLEVLERRHIILTDPRMRGGKQPYHFAENMDLPDARKHLKGCATASERLAREALRDVAKQLRARGYRVAGCGILLAAGRQLPPLAGILASHPLIHTAEGEFFRDAVRSACALLGIRVRGYRERELDAEAKAALGRAAARVQRSLAALGRSLGPPWTSDHKAAALAACLVLAGS